MPWNDCNFSSNLKIFCTFKGKFCKPKIQLLSHDKIQSNGLTSMAKCTMILTVSAKTDY